MSRVVSPLLALALALGFGFVPGVASAQGGAGDLAAPPPPGGEPSPTPTPGASSSPGAADDAPPAPPDASDEDELPPPPPADAGLPPLSAEGSPPADDVADLGAIPPPPEAVPAPPEGTLATGTLGLCAAREVASRQVCLDAIARTQTRSPEVRAVLRYMAAYDRELHERAATLFVALYGEAAPAFAEDQAPSPRPAPPESDGDATRAILLPSGFTWPQGSRAFNAYGLGSFDMTFGVSDRLQVGFQTTLPAGFVLAGAHTKLAFPFDGGSFAIQAHVLGVYAFSDTENLRFFLFGVGPALSLGSRDHFVTFGFSLYGGRGADDYTHERIGFTLPYVGGSARVGRRVRLNGEIWAPGLLRDDGVRPLGAALLILLGIRIFGPRFWGDVGTILPIFPGSSSLYEDLPLGIPYVGFGAAWR